MLIRNKSGITLFLILLMNSSFVLGQTAKCYDKKISWEDTMIASHHLLLKQLPDLNFKPYMSEIIRGGMEPVHISLDVSGVENLWLTTKGIPDYSFAHSIWGEAILIDKAGQKIRLSDMNPVSNKVGWGTFKVNQNAYGDGLKIGSKKMEHGVFAHAYSEVLYSLKGQYVRFEAMIGIDASTGGKGAVRFGVKNCLGLESLAQEIVTNAQKDFPEQMSLFKAYFPDCSGWFLQADNEKIEKDIIEKLLSRMNKSCEGELSDTKARLQFFVEIARECNKYDSALNEFDQIVKPQQLEIAIKDSMNKFSDKYNHGQEYLATLSEFSKDLLTVKQGLQQYNETALIRFNQYKTFRRKVLFDNPLLDFNDILFIKREFLPGQEMLGNHMCDQYFGFNAIKGGGLYVLKDAFSDNPQAIDVLKESVCQNGPMKGQKLIDGGFLSPDLSYDGKEIVFAFTEAEPPRYQWSEKSTFHIYKVKIDGTNLQQLTNGAFNDFDPVWLPSGRIAFISERRGGYLRCGAYKILSFGRCHGRPVPNYTLHSMNADGSDIVCLSPHETNEWHPSVNNDGMIIYTRWDYVDRGFNQAHHPWITSPDGRDARSIHGNFKEKQQDNPVMEMDVRAIPGSHKYVATATAHHGQAYGSLIMIDPNIRDDNKMGPLTKLTLDAKFPEADISQTKDQKYATAWPLNEDWYFCVYDAEGETARGPDNNYGIYLLHVPSQEKILIYRDPEVSCLSPIPLKSREKPPVIPHFSAIGKPLEPGQKFDPEVYKNVPDTGTVGVLNVYDSTIPFPKDKKIKYLRIMQILPKTTPDHLSPQISYGVEKSARAVLGTVPVEEDGSAYFELPAGIPVYFQALDENMMAIQSMKSATYVQPGERLVCMGCHEPLQRAPISKKLPKAFANIPSVIKPGPVGSRPFSFPRLVQPVLDRNCVSCHIKNADKAPDLQKGDYLNNPHYWYTSYINLRNYAFYYGPEKGYDRWQDAITVPGKFGAHESKLYKMLQKGHNDVKLSKEDMYRLTLWLDSNSDFFGAYENTKQQADGQVVQPALE
ncbi:MAG: NPCBM/NEW2 domain-containing protein [Phycisphaerae bacterium]|nr:NPCBM/NEW2 domain-containing protein [Phycisphaerae bacterium]